MVLYVSIAFRQPRKRQLNPSYMHASQNANNHGILEHPLLLHGILVDLSNLSRSRAPVSDKLDLELSSGNTEEL